jgi:hypothetical protein
VTVTGMYEQKHPIMLETKVSFNVAK